MYTVLHVHVIKSNMYTGLHVHVLQCNQVKHVYWVACTFEILTWIHVHILSVRFHKINVTCTFLNEVIF